MSEQEKHKRKSQKLKEKVDASIEKAQIDRGILLVITIYNLTLLYFSEVSP